MSAFEFNEIQLIKENKGNTVNVDTEVNGPYTNIIKFLGVVETAGPIVTNIPPKHAPGNVWSNLTDKEITFVRKLMMGFK